MECRLSDKKINSKTMQHVCIEFCMWLEKTLKETIVSLKKAFGDKCLSNSNIKKWDKEFKDGQKSIYNSDFHHRNTTLL